MHCLLIHQAFISPGEGGGTRHFEFARYVVSQGDEFTVVASNISYLKGTSIDRPLEEKVNGVRVYRAWTPNNFHRSFAHRIAAFVGFTASSFWLALRRGKQVDIVMGTSPSLFQAFGACMVANLRRKPFLLEIRDLWPEFAIAMGLLKSRVAIFFARRIEKFLYWSATHIIVNSPAYVDYLIEKKVDPHKITLIPNGVDPSMFASSCDGSGFRQRHQLTDKFVLTYAGAIGPANDIPTIVAAAKLLADETTIHFVLAGGGKALEDVKKMVSDLQLANVSFLGVLPKEEMAELLTASDACVATLMNIDMFKTTYPNKVFDYMAAGKPTLLGIDGVIRSVIEECGGGIYFPPSDAPALAEAARVLQKDQELCLQMGEHARKHVAKQFNRSDHVRQFHETLRRVSGTCTP